LIGDQSLIPALVEYAGRDNEPGPYFGNAGPLAAIQAAARIARFPRIFEEIPATALGKPSVDAGPGNPFHLWQHFGLENSSALEQASVALVLREIGNFDRTELPPWSPLFSETAMWELHNRLGILTLLLLPAASDVILSQALVEAAMQSIGSLAAVPVLTQVPHWGGSAISELAAARLGRLRSDPA